MNFLKSLDNKILFFDGALGTMLPDFGLRDGDSPEMFLYSNFEGMVDFHLAYINAGANIITANTFGANEIKLKASGLDPDETVRLAINAAKEAVRRSNREIFVAVDVGSTGKLLEPLGDLSFDAAYEVFRKQLLAAEKYGADIAIIETMTDTYEMKAAVLAARENTSLPVIASFSFDEGGHILTGADVSTAVALLEGLGVDALGVNCGFGPDKMSAIVDDFLKYSSLPVIVQANAGLPMKQDGKTIYNISAKNFAAYAEGFAAKGIRLIGGCCGTHPDYIEHCVELCRDIMPDDISNKSYAIVSSFAQSKMLTDNGANLKIAEITNPDEKKNYENALLVGDYNYILEIFLDMQDSGADIIDVDISFDGIDESAAVELLKLLQPIIYLPLRITAASAATAEKALRYYNGKAMLKFLGDSIDELEKVFTTVKKYGAVLDLTAFKAETTEKILIRTGKFDIKQKDLLL